MAKTQLAIVNDILRRLREDRVTATTDNDYAELIAQFVADAYAEVQDAHVWESLKHTINVALTAATSTYNLSKSIVDGGNVPNVERVCRYDSELLWLLDSDNIAQVWLLASTSDRNGLPCVYLSPEEMENMQSMDSATTSADPTYFTIYPLSDEAGADPELKLEVWPTPSASRVLKMRFWTNAEVLMADGNTDAYKLRIPERPVYLLALFYALNERGEEMGEPGNVAERRFLDALETAIEKDLNASQRSTQHDWVRR